MTAPHIAHAIWQTLGISVPTIWQGLRGSLTPEATDRRLAQWSAAIVRRAGIDLRVEGAEHATRGESFVLMSNHQSLYDVPVIYQSLDRRIRMVAKKELFRVPIWGRAMHAAGFISLDRQSRHDEGAVHHRLATAMGMPERSTTRVQLVDQPVG